MNRLLRSAFPPLLLAFLALISAYALTQLIRAQPPALSWLGLLLAGAAPLMFLLRSRLRPVTRRTQQPLAVSIVCGLGLAMTMAMNWRYGAASGSIHLLAAGCLIAWVIFLRWYSATGRD